MGAFGEFLRRLSAMGRDPDRDRLLAILRLNRELARAEGRRPVLTALVDAAVQLFTAERGFLVRSTAGEPGFAVEVARSLDRESVQHPERKVSTTLLRRVLGQGEPVFSEDAQEGEFGAAQSVADLKLRSVLCVPLQVQRKVIGCLYLDHRFQAGAFTAADLPWLAAFADQAAIVLHLFDLLQQNEEQQRLLAQQNEALQATVAVQAEAIAELGDAPAPTRNDLRHDFATLVGESSALLRALHVLDRVADADFAVLLTGESGTGKEVAARALHAASPRRAAPFLPVNLAALSPQLVESELFGHVQGAFTGAGRERIGLLREAGAGTLFLDEITELDPEVQVKLLRALEARKVRPVGGDREYAIDCRIVAATNRDPLAAVTAGRLRQDLYFRIAVVTVHLPPLRERTGDVALLTRHFVRTLRPEGQPPPEIDAALLRALEVRSWPGNVRQLRNELQRLLALAGGGPLQPGLLTPEAAGEAATATAGAAPPPTLELAALERWAIARALVVSGGNKAEAARLLGIGRRTLYSKLGE